MHYNLENTTEEEHAVNVLHTSHFQQSRTKGKCLAKYAERKPKLFYQIDGWGPDAAGDSVIDPRSSGEGMTAGSTWELMRGSPVRILIADDYTDHELIADIITQAAEWIRRDPELLKEHHAKHWDECSCDMVPF